jgi:hypothetical protein
MAARPRASGGKTVTLSRIRDILAGQARQQHEWLAAL